jgi:translation initiation factor 3 subunit A
VPFVSHSNSPLPEADLAMYTPALEKLCIVRMLQQVSQVYTSMRMPHLIAMIPFGSFDETEKLIVDAVKFNYLQVKIDYQNACVIFGSQQLESERIRNHLATLARRLSHATSMVDEETGAAAAKAAAKAALRASPEATLAAIDLEHRTVLARKNMIEKRKEESERMLLEQEKAEEERKRDLAKLTEEQERKRQQEEARKREEDRIRRDIEEKENEEAKVLAEQLNKKKGKKGAAGKVDEAGKLDKRQLMEDALSEQIRERQEAERKLNRLVKHMDHLERAHREAEVPLLQAAYAKQLVDDEKYHTESQVRVEEMRG